MKKNKTPSKKKEKKKKSEETKEETKLEQEVKQAEKEIDKKKAEELEFDEFLEEPEFQRGSPSLGRINISPTNATRLETDLNDSTTLAKTDNDSFKYNFGEGNKDEPKYQSYEKGMATDFIPRTEIENLGRTNLLERKEVRFTESPQVRLDKERNFEKYNPAKKIDKEQLGREKDSERGEIKYKPLN